MEQQLFNQLNSIDRQFLARGSSDRGLHISKAQGSYLFDADGRRYIDFTMGWCVGNLGWNNDDIQDTIRKFDGPPYIHPDYLYEPWIELAAELTSIMPGKLKKCLRATGGTEAVEMALQAAMIHTGRKKFISIQGSYHGNSIAARSLSGGDDSALPGMVPHGHRISPPLDERALHQVERLLAKENIAGFIMEPIICNLGILIPEKEFMQGLQHLCKKHGTLLIMDEIATGFWRTGRLFASGHFDLQPDILCLAKAITAGFAPMGATVVTEAVAKSLRDESFYSTYGWHPLSVAAALATLKFMRTHKDMLSENISDISEYIQIRLTKMPFSREPQLRIRGLAIGVDIGDENTADKIRKRCHEEGLLISNQGTTLVMFPALTVERRTAEEALDILEDCL